MNDKQAMLRIDELLFAAGRLAIAAERVVGTDWAKESPGSIFDLSSELSNLRMALNAYNTLIFNKDLKD